MTLTDRIEELASLLGCIAEDDCMLEDGHPDEASCAVAQAKAACILVPKLLPVLRAAVAYATTQTTRYGSEEEYLVAKWAAEAALVAAVEEVR